MTPLKNPCDLAASAVVHAYLHGRMMPALLRGAIVWAVDKRISAGTLPLLDETLRNDIDNHAVAAPASIPIQPAPQPSPAWRRDTRRDPLAVEGM